MDFSPNLVIAFNIVEIWFEIANGQISSIYDKVIFPRHDNGGIL